MNRVLFSNIQKSDVIDKDVRSLLRKVINYTLKSESFDKEAEISVTFCDNEYIKNLNREFRNIDRETDVLSFPMYDFSEDDFIPEDEKIELGDIVISVEKALEQSKEYNHSIERELAFLTVHSMLHLLGYDHEISKSDEKVMFDKQDIILKELGINR